MLFDSFNWFILLLSWVCFYITNSNLSQKANSSDLTNVSNVAAAANGKVELSGGPIKIIAYSGDGKWAFQQQYNDGKILSLSINDTQIAYDYYDGKTWTNKWTK